MARASIPPPVVDGKPATLRSGVEMRFTVTPSGQGGTVKVDGISMGAMPIRKFFAAYPLDIAQSGGWKGEATGVCRIGTQGQTQLKQFGTELRAEQEVQKLVAEKLKKGYVETPR